ncbi:dynamin family protein [Nonomuraea antimicrobica]
MKPASLGGPGVRTSSPSPAASEPSGGARPSTRDDEPAPRLADAAGTTTDVPDESADFPDTAEAEPEFDPGRAGLGAEGVESGEADAGPRADASDADSTTGSTTGSTTEPPTEPEPEPEESDEPETAETGSDDGESASEPGAGAAEAAADSAERVAAAGVGADQPETERAGRERVEELPAEVVEALTSALGALRESVADLRFSLDLPGSAEARQAQTDLLAQLENYVLPRVKTTAAPALIVIAGSTGAGKSTLVNSLAEKHVSRTGVRRPTTGTPVLVCHPEDHKWFAEGELLGGLERLEQATPEAGLGSLLIVTTEKLPQGVALLDTPDIDSVVEEHHEVAHRMLDAADLWIFVTTAARYADAPAWSLLRLAKERGARLAIVLSRVPQRSADVVLKHFVRMLTEYGLGDIDRFVIHESKVADGRLPDSEVTDLRLWLAELSVDEGRRALAVRETLNGVLNSFRTRVPALAKHLEAQVAFRAELRGDVEAAFLSALTEIDKASKNGSLLHGEVLARWQDFAGSGDLMRSLQVRRRGRPDRQAPERVLAFKAAIRTGLESVIVAAANRASEEVVARWRHRSGLGAKLGRVSTGRPTTSHATPAGPSRPGRST